MQWYSYNFLSLCFRVEENFKTSTTLIFKFYFWFFAIKWISYFYIYCKHFLCLISIFNLSPATFMRFLSIKDSFCILELWEVKEISKKINLKLKIKIIYLYVIMTYLPSTPPIRIKHLKLLFNVRRSKQNINRYLNNTRSRKEQIYMFKCICKD